MQIDILTSGLGDYAHSSTVDMRQFDTRYGDILLNCNSFDKQCSIQNGYFIL